MRVLTLIFLFAIVHHSTATIDIHALARSAKSQLQSLHDTASAQIKKLVDNIDPEKVKELDIFNIIPKATKKVTKFKNLVGGGGEKKQTLILDPHQGERLSYYFQQKHGYRGKRLISALGHGLPMRVTYKYYD